ncbi:MAG: hypothetical protein U9R16_10045, partial [Campylobacterota bacterium]|nr:hypothetical protein [Campylobacterota bacterium]
MKLPLKISLGASFISIVFMMFLFYNIHNQLTTFKKDVIVHEYNKELESLKNTTDLILEKAKNTLSLITIADSNSKRLLVKLKHRFEFYMSSVKEIKELRFVSIDGEELVVVSKDKL